MCRRQTARAEVESWLQGSRRGQQRGQALPARSYDKAPGKAKPKAKRPDGPKGTLNAERRQRVWRPLVSGPTRPNKPALRNGQAAAALPLPSPAFLCLAFSCRTTGKRLAGHQPWAKARGVNLSLTERWPVGGTGLSARALRAERPWRRGICATPQQVQLSHPPAAAILMLPSLFAPAFPPRSPTERADQSWRWVEVRAAN